MFSHRWFAKRINKRNRKVLAATRDPMVIRHVSLRRLEKASPNEVRRPGDQTQYSFQFVWEGTALQVKGDRGSENKQDLIRRGERVKSQPDQESIKRRRLDPEIMASDCAEEKHLELIGTVPTELAFPEDVAWFKDEKDILPRHGWTYFRPKSRMFGVDAQ
ncbi:unnamed protein product [Phytophthora lilii]|uniref:Unnamed protein product n=1 Tax=Phytophthora lilii TaxID=2077276 RepID=A0A9W6TYW3_9STRA|nr:unnamed protein product [Phytophthora lilii]